MNVISKAEKRRLKALRAKRSGEEERQALEASFVALAGTATGRAQASTLHSTTSLSVGRRTLKRKARREAGKEKVRQRESESTTGAGEEESEESSEAVEATKGKGTAGLDTSDGKSLQALRRRAAAEMSAVTKRVKKRRVKLSRTVDHGSDEDSEEYVQTSAQKWAALRSASQARIAATARPNMSPLSIFHGDADGRMIEDEAPAAAPVAVATAKPGTGFSFGSLDFATVASVPRAPAEESDDGQGEDEVDVYEQAVGVSESEGEDESGSEGESESGSDSEGESGSGSGSDESDDDSDDESASSSSDASASSSSSSSSSSPSSSDDDISSISEEAPGLSGSEEDDEVERARAKEEEEAAEAARRPLSTRAVQIVRPPSMAAARETLPVVGEEFRIMEAVSEALVTVVSADTGSGKSTQVPQFLYEGRYCADGYRVAVTEPRRVAAISLATRVRAELGEEHGRVVGYAVRGDSTVTEETRLKFCTDGLLLRETMSDFALRAYSAVVVDEAHERTLDTDVLLGVLSRIVKLRAAHADGSAVIEGLPRDLRPLKLVIMSATLRIDDFTGNTRLFPPPTLTPRVIHVEGRTFPVTLHHARTTAADYATATVRRTQQILDTLPPGGVLVFLTGAREVDKAVAALRSRAENKEVTILPLYAKLSRDAQQAVFDACAAAAATAGDNRTATRVVVVSTNVAETAVTLPGIRYVVDSGRVKTRRVDAATGVARTGVVLISRAAAAQRAGRAGRTRAGHAYRMYTSHVFESSMADFPEPAILSTTPDAVVLLAKAMGIGSVLRFPWPTAPPTAAIAAALRRLTVLGALRLPSSAPHPLPRPLLTLPKESEPLLRATPLGLTLAQLPLDPRLGKALTLATDASLRPLLATLVAAEAVGHVLHTPSPDNPQRDQVALLDATADALASLRAVGALAAEPTADARGALAARLGINSAAVREVRRVRTQLAHAMARVECAGGEWSGVGEVEDEGEEDAGEAGRRRYMQAVSSWTTDVAPPTADQLIALRQVLLAAYPDQVARRLPHRAWHYEDAVSGRLLRLPASSALRRARGGARTGRDAPEYVVYRETQVVDEESVAVQEEQLSRLAAGEGGRDGQTGVDEVVPLMRGVCAVEPEWLVDLAAPLAVPGNPMASPPPLYSVGTDGVLAYRRPSFGAAAWPLPPMATPLARSERDDLLYPAFAAALLDGTAWPPLRQLVPHLLHSPQLCITHPSQSKVRALVSDLRRAKVSSAARLRTLWTSARSALRSSLLPFYDDAGRAALAGHYPPTDETRLVRK
jgi:ATP-dependent RNA helicase DHX37/DHR1